MAAGTEGFRTLAELVPGLVFHIVVSVAGAQLLLVAARRADADKERESTGAPSAPVPSA